TGFEDDPYPQADYLRGALAALQAINPGEIARAGGTGDDIRQRIDKARLDALKDWKLAAPMTRDRSA
ncbi:MAG TPA: multifunctional CCA tRNA nucleotidyl transferase/2'3'-cyclic phosphodiesterase/2'nucleotidase/phosphatase, partial [Gammaproteobacteria bacterium]|nr:multifunctional CCA tRNA nucleotidyl transferase/2'3'-cyclic phosphodiesterase/2'nucleotidase/phosphatase [Gammaproteobacteria bacterium]